MARRPVAAWEQPPESDARVPYLPIEDFDGLTAVALAVADEIERRWRREDKDKAERRRREAERANLIGWLEYHETVAANLRARALVAEGKARECAARLGVAYEGGGGPSLMPRCIGKKADGSACERIVKASQRYCFAHDPSTAAQRKNNAAKAARAKAKARSGTLGEIDKTKGLVQGLIVRLLDGRVSRGEATAAFQGLNTLLRAIELERSVREVEVLEAEIKELRQALERRGLA